MDDSVRVDMTDMEDFTHFRDDKCQQLEEILAKDSRFEGSVVKRIRLEKESPKSRNPFDIQNGDGTHIVWFYEWEFNLLGEPEIVPYLNVQRKREQKLDSYLPWEVFGFFVSLIGLVATIIFLLSLFLAPLQSYVSTNLPYGLVILIIGLLSFFTTSIRKKRGLEKIDIESAREDPLFVDALSKLAGLAGTGIKDLDSYAERFRKIESKIMDRR